MRLAVLFLLSVLAWGCSTPTDEEKYAALDRCPHPVGGICVRSIMRNFSCGPVMELYNCTLCAQPEKTP